MWDTQSEAEEAFRNRLIAGVGAVVVLGLIGLGVYYRYYAHPQQPPVVPATRPQTAKPPSASGIENPVPSDGTPLDAKALPALNDSDSFVRDSLAGLLGSEQVQKFLVPQSIIRHVVVTVDNLPRRKVAVELRPIKPTPGQATAASQGDVTTLSPASYARYAPLISVIQSTDAKSLATVYFQLYPLLQQAYEDLGYPGQYFNDRLVQVIDDLLAAPDLKGPIAVTRPKVFYEYADPQLEERSAGQKLLIRMGAANEAIIKAKLRDIRASVAARPPDTAAPQN